jgi:hypothetical protein
MTLITDFSLGVKLRKSRDRMTFFDSNRSLFSLILIVSLGPHSQADDEQTPASTSAVSGESRPSLEEVRKLAVDLTHQDFTIREAATRKLPLLGVSVIEPVTEVALQDNLEAGLRAVSILAELYLSEDAETFDQSEAGLKRLMAQAKLPAVAHKAAQTLDDNQFTVTQRRAIAEVRRLGGQIQMNRDYPVLVNGEQIRPENGWAQAAAIGSRWKGGDEGLKHFARLKTLRAVYLIGGHALSDEALEQLRLELPDAEFQPRGRAMLGVGTSPDILGCRVTSVRADSAAGKANIRAGDIVVEISGKAVRRPEDLIGLIGEHDEGETVEIIALRGDPILRYKLIEMLTQPEQFSPIVAIAIVSQMRTKFTVSLGEWSIDD